MRLLLIIDDYVPKSTRVSPKMMHELACYMTRQGHDVVVLTPGTKKQKTRLLKEKLDGVHVWRFKSGPVKDVSRLRRLVNESALSFNAWLGLRSYLEGWRFDGIVFYSPSIFFGPLVGWLKKKNNCKAYLVLRDLFPQWAIDEGIIGPRSLPAKYLRCFERLNYQAADTIGLMSAANVKVFKELNADQFEVEVLPNWVARAQTSKYTPYWRERLGLSGKVIFLYGGNMGKAQDMPNLLRLARGMKRVPNSHFLFIGQGEDYKFVGDYIKDHGLENTTLLPSISQSEFADLLREVDVGLFSLAKSHTAHNFPGKMLGYIAYGVPLLGSVNPGNDLLPLICDSNAGFVYENGDDAALLASAQKLAECAETRESCGNNAKKLMENNFSVASVSDRLHSFFKGERASYV